MPKQEQNTAVVQIKEQVAKLQELGREIIRATVLAGEKYLDLCKYIRQQNLDPKIVRHQLTELGFHKVRISEINKVSQAPDEIWNEFEAKTLGFKKVLELARGPVIECIASVTQEPETSVRSQLAEMDATADGAKKLEANTGEGEGQEKSPEDKKADAKEKALRAAKALAKCAEEMGWRSKSFKLPSGHIVSVVKGKKPTDKDLIKETGAKE